MTFSERNPARAEWYLRWVLALALAGATLLVVQLARSVDGLRERLAEQERATWALQPAMYLPTFPAAIASGERIVVGRADDGAPTVLAMLSVTCEYSARSIEQWNRLSADGVRVIGIAVDDDAPLADFAAAHGVGFPLVTFPERKLHWMYRTAVVPQTVVIDAEGLILHARPGELFVGPALDSIRAAAELHNVEATASAPIHPPDEEISR